MSPQTGSTWHCELCQIEVWVRRVPKRPALSPVSEVDDAGKAAKNRVVAGRVL